MKALFGALICLVFTLTKSFAISGGPWSGGNKIIGVVGTYAGVLHDVVVGSNNLGIFTLSVPQTGLASGNVLIFTGERTFSGPITGLADPNSDTHRHGRLRSRGGLATVSRSHSQRRVFRQ